MTGYWSKGLIGLGAIVTLTGCGQELTEPPVSLVAEFELPIPISNNAVALAEGPDGPDPL